MKPGSADAEADIEADAQRALDEAKARVAPLDLTPLEELIHKGTNTVLPMDVDAQRDAWEQWFKTKQEQA